MDHWHHLFNPRQLLVAGLIAYECAKEDEFDSRFMLMMLGRVVDRNSRLCIWDTYQGGGIGGGVLTFLNQSLNTLANYSCRPLLTLKSALCVNVTGQASHGAGRCTLGDARNTTWSADIWITDSGYGDVIVYDELSEFFLAWYDKHLIRLFPGGYTDSMRALSVKGEGAASAPSWPSATRAPPDTCVTTASRW